jgi:hypothetical protein
MMLGKEQLRLPISGWIDLLQLLQKRVSLEQLVLHPQRERMAKGREPPRREGKVSLEQPLELQKRLVVEGDMIELCRFDAGDLQTGLDRVVRKPESCFLRVKRSSCAANTLPSTTAPPRRW